MKIVEEQMKAIKSFTYYQFDEISEDQFAALDLQVKKKLFTDFVNLPLFKY